MYSPLNLIAFALAVVLTIDDWRYKRRGGKRPSRGAKTFLLLSILVFVALEVLAFWLISVNPNLDVAERAAHGVGALSAFVIAWFFLGWEVSRWRIRRANPLPAAPKPGQD
jgi:hypothetical protein